MSRTGGAVAVLAVVVGACGSGASAKNADAGCTEIQASNYDQSCKTDSDCVMVPVGNTCTGCIFACGFNVGAARSSRSTS